MGGLTEHLARREELVAALMPDPGPIWEVHVLHSLPAGNPNRDRFGRPKEQTFGGRRRARISSQALKRATRELMREQLAGETLGIRTRNVAPEIARAIARLRPPEGWDEETISAVAQAAVSASGLGPDSKKSTPGSAGETASQEDDGGQDDAGEAIVFVSEAELEHIARVVCEHAGEIRPQRGGTVRLEDKVQKALKEPFRGALRPIEAALTGRFFASRPDDTIEAAVQVAHSLGIHPLLAETDFFSAVEERPVGAHAGAAHTGDADFNASCHYRYARIDVPQIAMNLDGENPAPQLDRARRAARAFLESFIDVVPRAKQASMNIATPASFALIVRRRRGGWNLANAFVESDLRRPNLVVDGVQRMDSHLDVLLESTGDRDLVAMDIVNRTGREETKICPVAADWQPGTRPGRLPTLLDHLAGR